MKPVLALLGLSFMILQPSPANSQLGTLLGLKLGIFGGGVLAGIGRGIRNVTRRRLQDPAVELISVRAPPAEETASADYVEPTRFTGDYDENFDYQADDDYRFDYPYSTANNQTFEDYTFPELSGTDETDILQEDVSIGLLDPNSELSKREPPKPTAGGSSVTTSTNGVDRIKQDDSTLNSTIRGGLGSLINSNGTVPSRLSVPDYSTLQNGPQSEGGASAINFQDIFSGIIPFPTEVPPPIYESILSNDDPQEDLENPEYVPDTLSQDTPNPKYGLEGASLRDGRPPASSTPRSTATTPATNTLRAVGPVRIHQAKLITRYSILTPHQLVRIRDTSSEGRSVRNAKQRSVFAVTTANANLKTGSATRPVNLRNLASKLQTNSFLPAKSSQMNVNRRVGEPSFRPTSRVQTKLEDNRFHQQKEVLSQDSRNATLTVPNLNRSSSVKIARFYDGDLASRAPRNRKVLSGHLPRGVGIDVRQRDRSSPGDRHSNKRPALNRRI
ncbi:uncharacterized protein LOC108681048 [Hyalella azteca]|uniref:Uncharacterized protein LOC108681048 n=1 Tax=Hyalella azteca TaxID=294128 RepID=A0A8B7PHN5_HYAAZ|nr:uncharacterized protein LOC108681048 [Hyalella azteca]